MDKMNKDKFTKLKSKYLSDIWRHREIKINTQTYSYTTKNTVKTSCFHGLSFF